jgi:hypothetical protein
MTGTIETEVTRTKRGPELKKLGLVHG